MSLRIDGSTATPTLRPADAAPTAAAPEPFAVRDGFQVHRSTPDELITQGDSSSVPQGDLQQGNTGPAVLELQNDLVKLGYLTQAALNTGPGIFGPHTLAAVKAFQSAHGVPATGYFGPLTRGAMEAALSAQAPAPAPAPSGTAVPPMDLKEGDSGPQVEQLQHDLVRLGYMSQADMNTGPGIFGPHTLAAVHAFQAAHGVPATGYYGPLTRAALSRALGGQAPAPQPPPVGTGLAAPAQVARQYLGRDISDLKYNSSLDLDKWPANTVCCANFVSACLEKAGELPAGQHNDSVHGLVNNLQADSWQEIPLSQAQPGDVVTFDGPEGAGQHVELFNGWVNGRPQYIGSNNINPDGTQQISYDSGAWAYQVHIYRHP